MSSDCPILISKFSDLFNVSFAPQLLFYSYIPIIVVSFFFGFYVFYKSKYSIHGRNLFFLAVTFSIFILNEIIQWIAVPAPFVAYGWALAPLFQLLVWIAAINFFYCFLHNGLMTRGVKFILFVFCLPLIVFLSTALNISLFDQVNCEGKIGPLWYYLYSFQLLSILFLIIWGIIKYRKTATSKFKNQILLLTIGISFFLLMFWTSNVSGEYFKTYDINLIGPVGMVVFIGLLTYIIIKFETFDIKLLGAQALVIALVILISSQFFFIQTNINRILTSITLAIAIGFGWMLIKSVELEVKRKEELQIMANRLAQANDQLRKLDNAKSEFISIASHQLRTPLTAIKGFISLLLEGSYGKVNVVHRDILNKVYSSNERLITLVEDMLNLSRIEAGRMEYNMEKVRVEEVIQEVYDTFVIRAKEKQLSLDIIYPDYQPPETTTDKNKIREVISNLVDNALKYTISGGVSIKLTKEENGCLRVGITDTGIGIPETELPYLFAKFSRGHDISRLNTGGTGLGLHVGKRIIEALRGKIWAESEGEGKGSTFYIEIPIEAPAEVG